MLNPIRPDIEQIIFATEADVARMFGTMQESLLIINKLATATDEESLATLARNREYLCICLSYQTIIEAGWDLQPFIDGCAK